jgi:hypothetical protein
VDAAARGHDPAKAAEAGRKCFLDDVFNIVETIRAVRGGRKGKVNRPQPRDFQRD